MSGFVKWKKKGVGPTVIPKGMAAIRRRHIALPSDIVQSHFDGYEKAVVFYDKSRRAIALQPALKDAEESYMLFNGNVFCMSLLNFLDVKRGLYPVVWNPGLKMAIITLTEE